jgi:hypothetical protein
MKYDILKRILINVCFIILFFIAVNLISNALDVQTARNFTDGWIEISWTIFYNLVFGVYLSYKYFFSIFKVKNGTLVVIWYNLLLSAIFLIVLILALMGVSFLINYMSYWAILFGFFLPRAFVRRNMVNPESHLS